MCLYPLAKVQVPGGARRPPWAARASQPSHVVTSVTLLLRRAGVEGGAGLTRAGGMVTARHTQAIKHAAPLLVVTPLLGVGLETVTDEQVEVAADGVGLVGVEQLHRGGGQREVVSHGPGGAKRGVPAVHLLLWPAGELA